MKHIILAAALCAVASSQAFATGATRPTGDGIAVPPVVEAALAEKDAQIAQDKADLQLLNEHYQAIYDELYGKNKPLNFNRVSQIIPILDHYIQTKDDAIAALQAANEAAAEAAAEELAKYKITPVQVGNEHDLNDLWGFVEAGGGSPWGQVKQNDTQLVVLEGWDLPEPIDGTYQHVNFVDLMNLEGEYSEALNASRMDGAVRAVNELISATDQELSAAIEAAIEDTFKEGYDEGFSDGYAAGWYDRGVNNDYGTTWNN